MEATSPPIISEEPKALDKEEIHSKKVIKPKKENNM